MPDVISTHARGLVMLRFLLALVVIASASGFSFGGGGLLRSPRTARSATAVRCVEPPPDVADDSYDSNKLVLAARKGKVKELGELLLSQTVEVNRSVRCTKIPTMDNGCALIWAARQGQLEAVRLLIRAKAEVNLCCSPSGWTALYAAALNGHEQIVQELLNSGADVEAALALGDERTNLNLNRMAGTSLSPSAAEVAAPPTRQSPSLVPVAVDPDPVAAVELADWKASQKHAIVAPPAAVAGNLGGMDELEMMRLRLEWRAPPTAEEQRAADDARQTVFKYRHDAIKEMEAQIVAEGEAPPPPPPPVTTSAASSAVVTPAAQPLAYAPSVGIGTSGDASIIARLEAVEAALAMLSANNNANSAFEKGFTAGFAAGRAAV